MRSSQPTKDGLGKDIYPIRMNENENKINDDDRAALSVLQRAASGMSAEDLGTELGLDKMPLFYQLDRLVKQGILKRSRPMFLQPELYEVTEMGREKMLA